MIKDRVIIAYTFASLKHSKQKRKFSGLPYFSHPKGVARKIEDLTRDEDMIISAFLHDVVEDYNVKIEEIIAKFGENVGRLVLQLTSDKDILKTFNSKAEYLLDKMLKMDSDALTLKLVDRQDNVQYMDKDCKTIKHKQFVKKYSLETKYILNGLKENRKDLNELQILIIDMIDVRLRYLDIKYLW